MKPDLTLALTRDLIDELICRFDHGGFCLMKTLVEGTEDDEHLYCRHWFGNRHTALGLLADCQARIIDSLREDQTCTDDI
jgi:hypothetical protein